MGGFIAALSLGLAGASIFSSPGDITNWLQALATGFDALGVVNWDGVIKAAAALTLIGPAMAIFFGGKGLASVLDVIGEGWGKIKELFGGEKEKSLFEKIADQLKPLENVNADKIKAIGDGLSGMASGLKTLTGLSDKDLDAAKKAITVGTSIAPSSGGGGSSAPASAPATSPGPKPAATAPSPGPTPAATAPSSGGSSAPAATTPSSGGGGGTSPTKFAETAGGAVTGQIKSPQIQQNLSMIEESLKKQGITDPNYIAAVKANVMKETGGKTVSENLNYSKTSNERIKSIFGKRASKFSDEELNKIKSDPQKMAEMMYGKDTDIGKSMGNTEEGDGFKYRGRGFIQLTGKKNYAAASKAIFGDDRLVKDPDMANNPETAAAISAWYMKEGQSRMAANLKIDTANMSRSDANILATSQIAGGDIRKKGEYGKRSEEHTSELQSH